MYRKLHFIEKKNVYNKILELSKQFYCYYKQFSSNEKESYGKYCMNILNDLLDYTTIMYFDNINFDVNSMLLKIKQLEIKLRVLKNCMILKNKQTLVLNKIIGDLLNELNYESRKQI